MKNYKLYVTLAFQKIIGNRKTDHEVGFFVIMRNFFKVQQNTLWLNNIPLLPLHPTLS